MLIVAKVHQDTSVTVDCVALPPGQVFTRESRKETASSQQKNHQQ
jgi:hypothetical protein